MMDVTSCGSIAGSACAAFHAVGPCICSWFVWTSAPVRSTTEERWPQDAEDLSHCLFQEQSLQRKEEEEDIRQCLKKYQCTDDCVCIGPSIYCIHPSMHPGGKGQANRYRRTHRRATWIDVNCLNCIELLFFIHFDEFPL